MEEDKKITFDDVLFYLSVGYLAFYLGVYLIKELSKLTGEAIVYTMPPSRNGNASTTGETVVTLEKETAENE